ncbi:MFS transporter [Kineococcus sp. SYSU DK002]|uniref:MFS transporter n=1 Tax=Kineococcus sp. SYSU DK002 TaxID=3383123 RepID=UPI003D7EE0E6
MSLHAGDQPPNSTVPAFPLPGSVDETPLATAAGASPQEPVSSRYIWLMVLAQFGVFVAFITPLAISLSIRLSTLAPGREEYLGYITGAGAAAVVLTNPLLGVLSDRTRTRLGRRRPFMIVGGLLGIGALTVMATAPSVLLLGLGWVLAQLTWGQALAALQTSQADRLPEHQRGKVAGLVGFATQVAPVLGVSVASAFATDNLLLFLVPGGLGLLLLALFICFVHEPDSRGAVFPERLAFGAVLSKYTFSPRRHPDYAWNWLGRFLFYFGLTLNTTFTAFFFAAKLGVSVTEVAGTIALLSLGGIVATTIGAIGGGFLSDRLRRRRIFVLSSGAIFAAGALVMAFSASLPLLMFGSLMGAVGIGMFAAVDQALLLDVLPERGTDAARYMGIIGLAVSIAQAVAPLIAPIFLGIGVSGGEKNYPLLYVVAAAFTLAGGAVVLRIKSVR